MTSETSAERHAGRSPDLLRTVAGIAVPIGAVVSVGLTFYAGHRSPQRLLLLVMAIWVLAPFIALMFANAASARWAAPARTTLYVVMLGLTLVSLAIYGIRAGTPIGAHPAAVFVIVPIASWAIIAIVVPIAALISRRR